MDRLRGRLDLLQNQLEIRSYILMEQMTGLDPEVDRIIEIAVLITNGNLDLVDETGCHYVVKTSKKVLDK